MVLVEVYGGVVTSLGYRAGITEELSFLLGGVAGIGTHLCLI